LIFSNKSIIVALGGENMIKTTAMLVEELKEYVNPTAKIRRLVDSGELVSVVRGLYETDADIPGYYLAPIIYGPSYLSFEFALAYYSLIPEAVYNFTSATFEKKKAKQYETPYGTFTYRDVPSEAYPIGIVLHSENGYGFQIASPEKAICDELYKISPVSNRNELESLLFEDLRIDREQFSKLNMTYLFEIATFYHTQNHKLLKAYLRRRIKNGSNN
jgi:predicted transcriptional regulator of viral defense system